MRAMDGRLSLGDRAVVGEGRRDDDSPPSYELPALGSDGKADDSTPELRPERFGANGSSGEWTGMIPADGQAAVAVLVVGSFESIMAIDVSVSSGEPHLYVRRAADGNTALELHGEGATASGTFGVTAEVGGRYQLALFVDDGGGGTFTVGFAQNTACRTDTDDAEPNEEPTAATPIEPGIHGGMVCNSSTGFDRDYFTVNVDGPDRILRAGLQHAPELGPLQFVVEGPFGPLQQTRTEAIGRAFSGEEVTVTFLRTAEALPEGSEITIGVWGDELYNIYELMTCFDDSLEGSGENPGNQDADTASEIMLGVTYERAMLCPVLGRSYRAAEPEDVDTYAVEVPPDTPVRITYTRAFGLTFDGPPDALQVGDGTWELIGTPGGRRVVFGITSGLSLDEPHEYDLTVEAI